MDWLQLWHFRCSGLSIGAAMGLPEYQARDIFFSTMRNPFAHALILTAIEKQSRAEFFLSSGF